MSLRITCPRCGPRPVEEYVYGGELPVVPDDVVDPDLRDVDRAWMRGNPEGPCRERWFHAHGCRRWLDLVRDTRTDRVIEQ